MITVACVLRTGGDYNPDYVKNLISAIREHLTLPRRIFFLTDAKEGLGGFMSDTLFQQIPLVYRWPGWWAKLEIFALKPPVLYFDLDTKIVGNIDLLANWVSDSCEGLMMLRGFYKGDRCSGIMGWRQDMRHIFDRFVIHYANRARFEQKSNGPAMKIGGNRYRGDQEWIAMVTRKESIPVTFAQDVFPGIYSYKVDVRENGVPDDARIICFHGKPRPHEVIL